MLRLLAILFVLTTATLAADFKLARIVDFQDVSEAGGGAITSPSPNGVATIPTSHAPNTIMKCEVTVELDGKTYTAVFPQDRYFQMTDLERGKTIPVRLDGKKLAMQRPSDGKEIKGKLIRDENDARK